jgi:hypothetical protein
MPSAQEHREQRAATLERAQETTGGGTAEGIEDEIKVMRDFLGRALGALGLARSGCGIEGPFMWEKATPSSRP